MTTRRAFIHLLAVSSAAGLAAACSQPAAAPTAPTAPPPKPAATSAPAAPTTAPAQAAPAATSVPAKPAAAPTSAAAGQPSPEWNALVAAAKQEGAVTVATYAGSAQRKVMDEFEKAFPGIKVEQTPFQSSSRDFVPRLLHERQAGLFLWDVGLVPSQEMLLQIKPIGGLQPIRPHVMLPDIKDDKYWGDGFEGGFPDNDKQYGYALMRSRYTTVYVNTDLVKEGEVASSRTC